MTHRIATLIGTVVIAFSLLLSSPASAREILHTVQKGQNLGMIAKRYHTTPEAIRKNNALKESQRIYPGQKLRIVEVPEHKKWREFYENKLAPKDKEETAPPADKPADDKKPEKKADKKPDKKAAKAKPDKADKRPAGHESNGAADDEWTRATRKTGNLTMVRQNETFRGKLVDDDGQVNEKVAKRLDRYLRSLKNNQQTQMSRRLFKLLAQVSDHYGGRTLIVVSGFRPFTSKQFTKKSRHNHGMAVDFRVAGVPAEALHAYCLGFKDVGCGYYPTVGFVHMDVRTYKTQWTDYSGPGEAPVYRKAGSPKAPPAEKHEPDEPADAKKSEPTKTASK
jgi:uncharacterized protein YcbK (DUF882 family)